MRQFLNKALLVPLLVVLLYVLAMAATNAHFMADSGGYIVSILAYGNVVEYVVEHPTVADYRVQNSFWDFGHLLWRPVGLLLFKVATPLSTLIVGPDPGHNALFLLMAVNFVAGLVSVILLYALIEKFTAKRWLAALITCGFILSHAFLNFTQTGSSYIAGLCFLIVALYLLLKDKDGPRPVMAILSGLACAAAITLWVAYVIVVPATIVAPIVLFGWTRERTRAVIYAGLAFGVATAVAFLGVMWQVGIHTPSDLRVWIETSSHGVSISGLARMVLGFARSFIHLGNDGLLFKRFLLKDPFNPVTAFELVSLSLWKMALFYLMLGSLALSLLFASSRRMLVLLLLTVVPLLLFAIKFDGGAVERYLPVYPVIFIALAWSLGDATVPRLLKVAPVVFLAFAVLVNSGAMARTVLDRKNQKTLARLHTVIPHLQQQGWLVTSHLQDDLYNFQASFPFEPINRHNLYHVYALVWLNTDQAAHWREEFAAHALERWAKGGDIWVSTRLLSQKPEASWNWAEGDDPRVRWADINNFFTPLEMCGAPTGSDGFVQLKQSSSNISLLNGILQTSQAATHSVSIKDCK